jgi:H+/Cl- antiporter ClcA
MTLELLKYLAKWLFISLVLGALVGSASAGFLVSLEWVTHFRESHLWLIAFLPLAGLAVGLLYHYYGKEVEAGNNLLIANIQEPKETIPFKMAPLVYVGTMVTHLFGGSAGREGTALQMAGGIADQLTKPFKLQGEERKILLMAAIAAGFGSVFGTPLAGAVFGVEVAFIGKVRYQALFPTIASSILAAWVVDLWQVPHTHYHIALIPALSIVSLSSSLFVGIVFGICAYLFSTGMHSLGSIYKSSIGFAPLRPVVGGTLVALGVWLLGTSKYIGLGVPTIVQSFEQPLPAYDFALKMAFTIVTLSAGYKGGEVTPLFFIGATLGNALSYFVPLPTGLLAGMGFVAVFAGATNTPIACTLMAIELFGAECGVYAALACVTAYLCSGQTSIYKQQLVGETKLNKL